MSYLNFKKSKRYMATFKSQSAGVSASPEAVYGRLSDLSSLKSLLDKVPADRIPADKRELFDSIRIDNESIAFPAGPVGELRLVVAERREPSLVRMKGEGAPVPLEIAVEIAPAPVGSELTVEMSLGVPAMMLPMLKGTVQKAVDQFAQVLTSIPYSEPS